MDMSTQNLGFLGNINIPNTFGHWSKVLPGAESSADIARRLDSPVHSSLYSSNSNETKMKLSDTNGTDGSEYPSLSLGLGQSPCSSDKSNLSSSTACFNSPVKVTNEESSVDLGLGFQLHLGNVNTYSAKMPSGDVHRLSNTGPYFDLELSLSTGPSESVVTNVTPASDLYQNLLETVPAIDEEGSESSCWAFANHFAQYATDTSSVLSYQKIPVNADAAAIFEELPSTMIKTVKSPVACTSGITNCQQRKIISKNCQFPGCDKGARGASGRCIAHGGGRRCQRPGCSRGAEGRTIYCKAHGGGRRCEYLGCTKSAEGRTDHCIAHGGGRRCTHEGCTRAARGKSGLCIRHGGGKRCKRENCTKSAEGFSGLCISHGGGRRCQFPECSKGAQGSTIFCKAHGGGKRCTFLGCTKGAEGSTAFCKGHGGGKRCSYQGGGVCPKSVHGGTQFCVAHGGGKRCAFTGCTRSARGRTDCCVRHGGGKRCQYDKCDKSAQGSTDFCKAHGGGKRCSWGHPGSNIGKGDRPCDRLSRSKTGLCVEHGALVEDRCVHGGGLLGPLAGQFLNTVIPQSMKEITIDGETLVKTSNEGEGFLGCAAFSTKRIAHPPINLQYGSGSIPEGRVRGGNLMAFLSGNATFPSNTGSQQDASTSEHGASLNILHNWM
ncbi:uncharacterized protein [Typha latifolia]|uniref:uncharacterized protein n=1 Tax=Typha latifolia TaxID=4733 RepID=UPI003C2EE704